LITSQRDILNSTIYAPLPLYNIFEKLIKRPLVSHTFPTPPWPSLKPLTMDAQLNAAEKQFAQVASHTQTVRTDLLKLLHSTQNTLTHSSPSTGFPLPPTVQDTLDELAAVGTAKKCLESLHHLHALIRTAEKTARPAERASTIGDNTAFIASIPDAVGACCHVLQTARLLRQTLESDAADTFISSLDKQASQLFKRTDDLLATIKTLLTGIMEKMLKIAKWPPPIANTEASLEEQGGAQWPGFEARLGPDGLQHLQYICSLLVSLQVAYNIEEFQKNSNNNLPVIWPLEVLAAPLASTLSHHFAQGLPTDRADKPEWLFDTALNFIRQCAPHTAELQPSIHHMQQPTSLLLLLPLEFPKAVHAMAVHPLLESYILPRLASSSSSSTTIEDTRKLWLHYADEAAKYERTLGTLCGSHLGTDLLPASTGNEEDDDLAIAQNSIARPGSAIEVLFKETDWMEGWFEAERWDTMCQLDIAVDEAPGAWEPSRPQSLHRKLQSMLGDSSSNNNNNNNNNNAADINIIPSTTTTSSVDDVAARSEFWPPQCTESALALFSSLMRRCGWVHACAYRLAYFRSVPLELLKDFRGRLASLLEKAEHFRDLLGDGWLPRVGAALCAAHYLEYKLQDPMGILLQLELQEERLPSGSKGRISQLVGKEADAFGALRRRWSYQLAKAAVAACQKSFSPYRRDLATFTSGDDDNESNESRIEDMSPKLLKFADALQTLLKKLSHHVDEVVFRDLWKSIAVAVNASMFNDVATEAIFSQRGAKQFEADVMGLMTVFGVHTSRPRACFKECLDAVRLLVMSEEEVLMLKNELLNAGLVNGGGGDAVKGVLRRKGVNSLNGEQVLTVLGQRL